MLYIDEKFVGYISSSLRNFKKRKNGIFNFSCPICGDSKKVKSKARGYLFPNKGRVGLLYKCHNCGISINFPNFLKENFPNIYDEYVLERYKNGIKGKKQKHNKPVFKFNKVKFHSNILDELSIKVNTLEDSHIAKQFLIKRKIPNEYWNLFYYTSDYSSLVQKIIPNKYKNLPENDYRIIIPFLNIDKKLIGFQGRALLNTKLRYITIQLDENLEMLFGIDRYDNSKKTYIVEGPIDSLFLPNSIAVAGSDLLGIEKRFSKIYNCVFVFDNEPRNKEIIKLMKKVIDAGKNICIWPDSIVEKDINEMIISGKSKDEIKRLIDNNTYANIEAELMFNRWKKC